MSDFYLTSVAAFFNGKVEIIPNDYGNRVTPSYIVAFNEKGERLVGEAAKRQFRDNPGNTAFNIKRMMGRDAKDKQLQKDMRFWPFKVSVTPCT